MFPNTEDPEYNYVEFNDSELKNGQNFFEIHENEASTPQKTEKSHNYPEQMKT